MLRVPT